MKKLTNVIKEQKFTFKDKLEQSLNEAKITSDAQFKEWSETVLKNAFGDKYDSEKSNKVVNGLLSKYKDNYGAMVGALSYSLNDSELFIVKESVNESDNTEGDLPEYEEGKFYDIEVSKKDLTALRKRFDINRDGQAGTRSSGFEVSGDKSSISGRGKIWMSVLKELKKSRSASNSNTSKKDESVNEAEVTSEKDLKEYAESVYKKAFGDKYDQKIVDELITDLIKKHGDDYGAMVGTITSGLGEEEINEGSIVASSSKMEKEFTDALRKAVSKFDFDLSDREPGENGYESALSHSVQNLINYFNGKSYLS